MRRTITISVSDEMHSLIYRGMESRLCSTVSEYLRLLVRRDQMPTATERKAATTRQTANEVIADGSDADLESFGIYRV